MTQSGILGERPDLRGRAMGSQHVSVTPALSAATIPVESLTPANCRAMYDLFRQYYADAPFGRFLHDLSTKQRIVLLREEPGALAGFSTIAVHRLEIDGKPVRIVFSGDTIIDERHWGSQKFAFEWIRETGRIKAAEPEIPLYWLLISKGHRTYRYLDAFGLDFTPDWRGRNHPSLDAIRDAAASRLFSENYDPQTGLLTFSEPRGRLASQWAALSPHERARPDIAFFLERNPGYWRGDELVCLCALEEANMRPLTRRLFRQGLSQCPAGAR